MRGRRLPLWAVNLTLRALVRSSLALVPTPHRMRANFEARAPKVLRPPEGSRFEPVEIPGARGPIPALWCRLGATDEGAAILYLHGGAYIAGSTRTHRHLAAALSGAAGLPVLLPDYALAPEQPFPAALEDARAAHGYLLERRAPERLGLGGDSAGGGLAAALLLRAARTGLPAPGAAVFFSPWVDLTMRAESLRRNARADAMLPVRRMPEVVETYLQGHDPSDPEASPVFGRYAAPPPALILAGAREILADDATGLARALEASGGVVELALTPRVPHAWPVLAGLLAEADAAVARAGRFFAGHLGTGPRGPG